MPYIFIPPIAVDEKNKKKFDGASTASPAFSALRIPSIEVIPELPS
jgi:hypothetical protein